MKTLRLDVETLAVVTFAPAANTPAARATDTNDCDTSLYSLWWTCTCFGTSH